MKIRNGFVSNSSSSSFVLYGIHTTEDVFNKDEFKKLCEEAIEDGNKRWKRNDTYEDYDQYEKLECYAGKLYIEKYPYDDQFYIGLHPDSQGMSETKGEFFERIQKTLKEELAIEVPIGKIELQSDTWRD